MPAVIPGSHVLRGVRRSLVLCALAVGTALPTGALAAQPPDSLSADGEEGRRFFDGTDLAWAGVFAGGLLLVKPAAGLERSIARAADDDGAGLDAAVATVGDVVGNGYLDFGLAASTYVAGTLAGSPVAARVGLRALESLALATGVTGAFKAGLGRERPGPVPDSDNFRFFELDHRYRSFPSGHASQLFAIAGTLSRELGDRAEWVPYLVYPLAAFVGVSRVVGREHWPTDVISGAAVGVLSSRMVGRLHAGDDSLLRSLRPLVPAGRGGGVGVALSIRTR